MWHALITIAFVLSLSSYQKHWSDGALSDFSHRQDLGPVINQASHSSTGKMQKNGSPGWTHLPIFPVVLSWILVINSCLGKINKQDKYWVASCILQAEFKRHGRPDKYMAVARSWFPITAGWSEVATAALIPASAPTYCHRENMTEKGCACFSAIAIHSLHTDVRVPRRDWLIQNTCSSCSRKLHFRSSGFSFYLSFLIFR